MRCQKHAPMSFIHQKNSETLVMTWFEGFFDTLIYIKVKGGITIHTNRWTVVAPFYSIMSLYIHRLVTPWYFELPAFLCRKESGAISQFCEEKLAVRKRAALAFLPTGWFTVSGQSETPLFTDRCGWIILISRGLMMHSGGFDFLKKMWKFLFCQGHGQVVRLSPVNSQF